MQNGGTSTPLPGQVGIFDGSGYGSTISKHNNPAMSGPFNKPLLGKTLFKKNLNPNASFEQNYQSLNSSFGGIGVNGNYQTGNKFNKTGLHRSLNLDLFPIGIHWYLDPRSIAHIHSESVQITNNNTTLKVRNEARNSQRIKIKQNSHNLNKFWMSCLGDKALTAGMLYYEVSLTRSDSWKVGVAARDEYITSRYTPDPKFIWTLSYNLFPTELYQFETGMSKSIRLNIGGGF